MTGLARLQFRFELNTKAVRFPLAYQNLIESQIIFTFQDNGFGMDKATRKKLFTLFFSSQARKGTGLGLFISHKIIQQHGGTISVQSKLGCGATFKVRIPKKPAKSGGSAPLLEAGLV
jgi:signal transduction histidine kinase